MNVLDNVRVGDKVFVITGHWATDLSVHTVAKIGKLHITLDDGSKWNRRTERKVGAGMWSCESLTPYSEEEWAEFQKTVRMARRKSELLRFKWDSINDELAEKVHALVLPKETGGTK